MFQNSESFPFLSGWSEGTRLLATTFAGLFDGSSSKEYLRGKLTVVWALSMLGLPVSFSLFFPLTYFELQTLH